MVAVDTGPYIEYISVFCSENHWTTEPYLSCSVHDNIYFICTVSKVYVSYIVHICIAFECIFMYAINIDSTIYTCVNECYTIPWWSKWMFQTNVSSCNACKIVNDELSFSLAQYYIYTPILHSKKTN